VPRDEGWGQHQGGLREAHEAIDQLSRLRTSVLHLSGPMLLPAESPELLLPCYSNQWTGLFSAELGARLLIVCRPGPMVYRVLELAGLDTWVTDWNPEWSNASAPGARDKSHSFFAPNRHTSRNIHICCESGLDRTPTGNSHRNIGKEAR
jgi:hypothetical protein